MHALKHSEIRERSKFSEIRMYEEILCISWLIRIKSCGKFLGFTKNENNPSVISYYKPLKRQYDKVKRPKHKNWWFLVTNNFRIVFVFAKPKNWPNNLIQTSLHKRFLHVFWALRIISMPHFNFEKYLNRNTSHLVKCLSL